MNGTIVGGWEFVWAAYGLTATALLLYGVNLVVRLRRERQHAQRH
jgi:heme exporter protein D